MGLISHDVNGAEVEIFLKVHPYANAINQEVDKAWVCGCALFDRGE